MSVRISCTNMMPKNKKLIINCNLLFIRVFIIKYLLLCTLLAYVAQCLLINTTYTETENIIKREKLMNHDES